MNPMQRGTFTVLNPQKPTNQESWWIGLDRDAFHRQAHAKAAEMTSSEQGKAIGAIRRESFPKKYQRQETQ